MVTSYMKDPFYISESNTWRIFDFVKQVPNPITERRILLQKYYSIQGRSQLPSLI